MKIAKFIAAALICASAAQAETTTQILKAVDDRGRTNLNVYLPERITLGELYNLSATLRKEEVETEKAWIGFFLGEPAAGNDKPGQTWATSVCDGFLAQCDDLGLRVSHFTKEEWDSFGKDGGMVPPDSAVIGIWDTGYTQVSLYKWRGETFMYERWSDGSGTPHPVIAKAHEAGTEYFDARYEYDPRNASWVVHPDGSAQAWESGRAVEDFAGRKIN